MRSASRKSRFALLAGAVLFSAGAWSMPPEGVVTRSEAVKYDPKEAATPEGAAALYARLQLAAARVCRDPAGFVPGATDAESYASCVKGALGEAVRAVKTPIVAVIHAGSASPQDAALARR